MKYIVSAILALLISTFVVYGIYTILNDLRNIVEVQGNHISKNIEKQYLTIYEIRENHMIEYQTFFLNCSMETNKSSHECYQDIVAEFNKPALVEAEKTKYDIESGFVIKLIYTIIVCSLFSQLMLFFLQSSSKKAFYISEFNLNAPATLGILGTIFSFAIVASLSKDGNIQSLFLANFFNAVITTALGVTVYIINLFLNIYIAPKINFK